MHISPYFIEFGLFYEINGSNKTHSTPKSFSDEKMILLHVHGMKEANNGTALAENLKEQVWMEG